MNSLLSSSSYLPDDGLKDVLDLALEWGMPLLVTGEPGTGKTQLAYHVARKLGLEKPLIFNTKTDSQARDLFYAYDAIRHFREAGMGQQKNALDYISFNALGKALLESGEKRAVVLIDEIDKAPRDFPNDLLYEMENLAFQIKEATVVESQERLGQHAQVNEQGFVRLAKPEHKPILILTSNSEKNLPDAFLRRVLYHHIDFPTPERLKEIVTQNIKPSQSLDEKLVKAAIDHFVEIRDLRGFRKKPATAELLAWIHVLHKDGIDLEAGLKNAGTEELKRNILRSYALIAKNKEDLGKLKKSLGISRIY
ncbi:MAG: MoxR family ATPase [Bacteroidota bacterium]